MAKTYVDELVDFPSKALYRIGTDKMVVGLLLDNPGIEISSEEADSVFDDNLFDYLYVDETTTEATAYIEVETEVTDSRTQAFCDFRIYVHICCHKNYMKIDPNKFPGISGNRRDNLVRYVDKVLNGSTAFGVGKLILDEVHTVPAPTGFTAREMTYVVPNFARRG